MTTTTKLSSSTVSIHSMCSSNRVEKENCNNSTIKSVASPRRSTASATRGIRGRRRLKSALYFAFAILCAYCSILPTTIHAFATTRVNRRSGLYERKSEWVERSVQYYSTVMRKAPSNKSSSQTSQLPHNKIDSTSDNDIATTQDEEFVRLATKHYYARHLIKRGSWEQAEKVRRCLVYSWYLIFCTHDMSRYLPILCAHDTYEQKLTPLSSLLLYSYTDVSSMSCHLKMMDIVIIPSLLYRLYYYLYTCRELEIPKELGQSSSISSVVWPWMKMMMRLNAHALLKYCKHMLCLK